MIDYVAILHTKDVLAKQLYLEIHPGQPVFSTQVASTSSIPDLLHFVYFLFFPALSPPLVLGVSVVLTVAILLDSVVRQIL